MGWREATVAVDDEDDEDDVEEEEAEEEDKTRPGPAFAPGGVLQGGSLAFQSVCGEPTQCRRNGSVFWERQHVYKRARRDSSRLTTNRSPREASRVGSGLA
ncbi:hypothetical protein EHS25_009812 [Saitozyma podzolica]|uniref:Uncharacterized protein n=1 Tax=Saitozyma podzolica TaxID=1890683 RepID=A0A427YK80_9TREE|nr:hypothetical protein EHS25_009812 [Saitozyma podzolica]